MTDETKSPAGEPQGPNRLTRRRLVKSGAAAIGATVVWSSPFPFADALTGTSAAYANGVTGPTGPAATAEPQPPTRAGYCSVKGNTFPNGTAIAPGTFLDLQYGQPDWDPHYAGATPAIYIEGKGITCDPPPPGYVDAGLYHGPDTVPGLYTYWRRP
jgi:hypothetical protein